MSERMGDRRERSEGTSRREVVRDRERQFNEWVQVAVRYFVLANAGAAVATLSFIGTTGRDFPRIALLALACFIVGIIFAGLVIFDQLVSAWRAFLFVGAIDASEPESAVQSSWVTRWAEKIGKYRARLLAGAFGLFIFGCTIGVGSLVLW